MIEFATLLLGGLIVGLQPVELIVHETVETVEVRLDGEVAAMLERPPWQVEIDFGAALAPRALEAVALDREGRELDRARQWVNLSPQPAQASLVIDRGRNGVGAVARVGWESLAVDSEPRTVVAYFDGRKLPVEDPRAIALPAHDPDQTHHLRVELKFSDLLRCTAEAIFGGVFGDRVSTELTALPIVVDKGVEPSSPREVEGWFAVGDEPLGVHAVETALAEIVIVRDLEARSHLKRLTSRGGPFSLSLKKDHRVRFVSTCSREILRRGYRHLLYPLSQTYAAKDGGLLWLLTRDQPAGCPLASQSLANAVAVAGLVANQSGARRAVVLVAGSRPRDASNLRPEQVRSYLRDLRVPLLVWNPVPGDTLAGAWGPATDISHEKRLTGAFGDLRRLLRRQRIVWLEGLHLPQTVNLHPRVTGVRLAGE